MAVTEALVELLASQAGKTAVKRIDVAETQLFESGAHLRRKRDECQVIDSIQAGMRMDVDH